MPSRLARTLGAAILAAALLACLTPPARASDDAPAAEVGRLAPELRVQDLINAPDGMTAENLNWKSLRGKVVVLEFWATWCGPCVAAIPHLNRLTEQYKDKDVVVIAISDEPRETVANFLEQRPMRGIVAMNPERNMFRDYGIRGIPHTVVVDAYGRIADITHPSALTDRQMARYLSGWRDTPSPSVGSEPPAPSRVTSGIDPYSLVAKPPVFQLILREAGNPKASVGSSMGDSQFTLLNTSRDGIIRTLYRPGPGQSDLTALPEDNKRYDFILHLNPQAAASQMDAVRSTVLEQFGVELVREQRELSRFIIRQDRDGHKLGEPLTPDDLTGHGTTGTAEWIEYSGITLRGFASVVAYVLGGECEDQTMIQGEFNIRINFEHGREPEQVIRAIREQLGLVIDTDTVKKEVMVFRPIANRAASR